MSSLRQERVTDPTDPLVVELAERQYRWRIRHRYRDEASGRAAALALVQELLGDSRLLRTPVGFLWLGPDGDHTPVFDVRADDVADVPTLRELVTTLAGARLGTSTWPGEPSREAFVDDGTFRLSATTMRLDVTGPVPGEELAGRVEAVPMTAEEVAAYATGAVAAYAASRAEAGESPELAHKVAVASFDELLPGGRAGPGHTLLSLRHGERHAAMVWVCERWPAQAWVYDVEVDPELRGRGLGAAAMVHAARLTRDLGLPWLGLNVFGPNVHARSLYARLGYVVEEEHLDRPA